MTDLVFVKPREGLSIVDPVRRDRLPQSVWRQVERAGYWQRLVAMGDVSMAAAVPESEVEGHERPAAELEPEPEPAVAPETHDHGAVQ